MGNSKQITIETLERAQHEDILRLQKFGATTLASVLLGLFDDKQWPTGYPGLVKETTATETPLRGHVLSGLMVECDEATHLTVTPGTLIACVTNADADESLLDMIRDPGVSDSGTLVFTTNPSGGVRLDIVEVEIDHEVTLEQATRGVFNETTKVFSPQTVDKVVAPRLNYRIRTGTSGAGLPALASGWLPLVVVNVQVGATGFDVCDVWDVRPLLADRIAESDTLAGPTGTDRPLRSQVRGVGGLAGSLAGAENGWRGYLEGSFNGYKVGGELRESVAIASGFGAADHDTDFLLGGSQSQAVGAYTPAAGGLYHIAAVFPAGLPRWVRYSQDPDPVVGARVPRGPRGILLFTTTQPDKVGYYSALTLPTACGFTATAPGVALLAGGFSTGPTTIGSQMRDNVTSLGDGTALTVGGLTGTGTNVITWTFDTTNTSFPKHATELIVDFDVSADAAEIARLTVEHKAGVEVFDMPVKTINGPAGSVLFRAQIPLWTGEVDGTDTGLTIMKFSAPTAALTVVAKIAGWVTP